MDFCRRWTTLAALCVAGVAWLDGGAAQVALTLDRPLAVSLRAQEDHIFCYSPPAQQETDLPWANVLAEVTISVDSPGAALPWYAVRGVSTDDVHRHVEALLAAALGAEPPTASPLALQSALRDLFSSCPSPLFGGDAQRCVLRFSALGTACVRLRVPTARAATLVARVDSGNGRWMRALWGLALLALAQSLAKSKIFQYGMGSLLFVIAGLAMLLALVSHRLLRTSRSRGVSALDTLVISSIFFTYGAALMSYLRLHLRQWLLDYWEVCLGYVAVSWLLGLGVVRFVRGSDGSKHVMTVMVKWFLRLVGLTLVYHAFASPLVSLLSLAFAAFVYLLYALHKWLSNIRAKQKTR